MTKHPPVFFAIVGVRHEPLLALKETFPRIQDALRRNGFSGSVFRETADISTVDEGTNQILNTFAVFNAQSTRGFTFNDQGTFSYHTTEYTNREDLFSAFALGLGILDRELSLQTLIRVGVRMVDLIRPSDWGLTLEQMVDPRLLGFRGLPCAGAMKPGMATMEQRFVSDDAELITKFDCLPDGFGIQADLYPVLRNHTLPATVTSTTGVLHGLLDIDSGTRSGKEVAPRKFSQDAILDELVGHNDRISEAFRAAVTPLALKTWGLKP